MPNSIDFYEKILLHVISVRIIVLCFQKQPPEGLCQSLLFNKAACFLVNFAKFLRAPFSQKTSGQLPV